MGAVVSRPRGCELAREWVSLQVDQELSEFETALLDAHLRKCAACGGFRAGVAAFTAAHRAAPLERLGRPIALPRRRSGSGAFRVGVAAAAAIVIALGTAAGVVSSDRPRSHIPFHRLNPAYLDYPANQLRLVHQNDPAQGYGARAL